MNMNFDLKLTMEQKLIMTQEMQLSVKLLQMSSYELQEYVEKEIEENPIIDVKDITETKMADTSLKDYKKLVKYLEFDNYSHKDYDKQQNEDVSPFLFISGKKTLKEYLNDQLIDMKEDNETETICRYIIENIDARGYLCESIQNIALKLKISKEKVQDALSIVQSFEPDGIGARDLKECLKLQAAKKGMTDENIYTIIDNYLEYLAENRYAQLSKILGIDSKKAQEYGDFIKSLQPKPSRGFYTGEETKYIIPDAYIKKLDDKYYIIMNDDVTPKLTINSTYKNIILNDGKDETAEYVKEKLNSAEFLIKSIEHRRNTVYRVLEKIVELQKDYFDYGDGYLKPMTLKQISEDLGIHESTVSRAIREKYIYTSRGTLRIKDLFTASICTPSSKEGISSKTVKKEIEELIGREDKHSPLSDQAICNILNESGMNISRRTVAKYREESGIKSSGGRKRF